MTKRKHYDFILAWANGAEIEFLNGDTWDLIDYPSWKEEREYRIKPEPKPDIVLYAYSENCIN